MSLAFKKLLMPAVIGGGVTLTVLWHIFPMRLDTYGILDAFSYKVLDQPYLVGDLVRPAVPFDVNQGPEQLGRRVKGKKVTKVEDGLVWLEGEDQPRKLSEIDGRIAYMVRINANPSIEKIVNNTPQPVVPSYMDIMAERNHQTIQAFRRKFEEDPDKFFAEAEEMLKTQPKPNTPEWREHQRKLEIEMVTKEFEAEEERKKAQKKK